MEVTLFSTLYRVYAFNFCEPYKALLKYSVWTWKGYKFHGWRVPNKHAGACYCHATSLSIDKPMMKGWCTFPSSNLLLILNQIHERQLNMHNMT